MVLAKEKKKELVETYRHHTSDTGSPSVQIALITERINEISQHLKGHTKDHSSRRGLLVLVSKRRSLLQYLRKHNSEEYFQLIKKLGLRK